MTNFLSPRRARYDSNIGQTVRASPRAASHRSRRVTTPEHSFPYEVVAGWLRWAFSGLPFPESCGMGATTSPVPGAGDWARSTNKRGHHGWIGVFAGRHSRISGSATMLRSRNALPQLASGRVPGGVRPDQARRLQPIAGATKTTAHLDDGHWVIMGPSSFITTPAPTSSKLVHRSPPR